MQTYWLVISFTPEFRKGSQIAEMSIVLDVMNPGFWIKFAPQYITN